MLFGLVADDLTGACDSGVPFLAAGRVIVSLWPCLPDAAAACLAISTESREADADEARRRSQVAVEALRAAGVAALYCKIDSQMRGNVVAHLAGALDAWGGKCVLVPALPGEGRVTIGGRHSWPGGEVDLRELTAGLGAERIIVRDAATDADLDQAAREIASMQERVMPAGSAGLAAHLPAALGYDAPAQ